MGPTNADGWVGTPLLDSSLLSRSGPAGRTGTLLFIDPVNNRMVVLPRTDGEAGTAALPLLGVWVLGTNAEWALAERRRMVVVSAHRAGAAGPADMQVKRPVMTTTANRMTVLAERKRQTPGAAERANASWALTNARTFLGGTPTWTNLKGGRSTGAPSASVAFTHRRSINSGTNMMTVFDADPTTAADLNDWWDASKRQRHGFGASFLAQRLLPALRRLPAIAMWPRWNTSTNADDHLRLGRGGNSGGFRNDGMGA